MKECHDGNDDMKQQIRRLRQSLAKLANKQAQERHSESEKLEATLRLFNQWRTQNEGMLCSTLQRLHRQDEEEKRRSYHQKVTSSLYFEKIDDRRNMIHEKDAVTLGWVFDPPADVQLQWSDISAWLRGSNGLYWISGKAGSGKSTLMNWLLQESRTKKFLKSWSGHRNLVIASHFFWNPGTNLQKSLSGLLRSLLYDLLRQWPNAIPQISSIRWRYHDLGLTHFPAWSDRELLIALKTLSEVLTSTTNICLFIDGLDEFSGKDDQKLEVVDFLKSLSNYPHVKICVSSRRLEVFKDTFASFPSLRLEDLTRKDIENFINAKLQANNKFDALQQSDPILCSVLVSEIIEKARGVWLWVMLVVRSLLEGLRNHDTASDMLLRLKDIPEELEDYFLHMFSKIDRIYRPKALRLLCAAFIAPILTLMTASFLDEEDPEFYLKMPLRSVPEPEITERLLLTESRVNIRCLGMLEVTSLDTDTALFYRKRVEFLHRTARDFFFEHGSWKLESTIPFPKFDVHLFKCQAMLAQLKMATKPEKTLLFDFMDSAEILERHQSQPLMPLLDHLNEYLNDQRHKDWHNGRDHFAHSWRCSEQGPVPLLPIAIQYGLSRYTRSVFKANSSLVARQPDRPLLDTALRRRMQEADHWAPKARSSLDTPDIETVRLILAHGGDPNQKLGDTTVWKAFMRFFDTFGAAIQQHPEHIRQRWIDVTELLIRYGAVRVLETDTIIPRQSSGKITVRVLYRQKLARESLAAAFGEGEAARLDFLARRLNATGQNLLKKITKSLRTMSM